PPRPVRQADTTPRTARAVTGAVVRARLRRLDPPTTAAGPATRTRRLRRRPAHPRQVRPDRGDGLVLVPTTGARTALRAPTAVELRRLGKHRRLRHRRVRRIVEIRRHPRRLLVRLLPPLLLVESPQQNRHRIERIIRRT